MKSAYQTEGPRAARARGEVVGRGTKNRVFFGWMTPQPNGSENRNSPNQFQAKKKTWSISEKLPEKTHPHKAV